MSSNNAMWRPLANAIESLARRVRHLETAETPANATSIQGVAVTTTAPADGEVLIYDSTADEWAPAAVPANDPLVAGTGSLLTLDVNGAITVTSGYHRVDTYESAANDNLDTINGGVSGQLLVLQNQNSARQIAVRDNVGNIQLSTVGQTFTLGHPYDKLVLLQTTGTSVWVELCRADNA